MVPSAAHRSAPGRSHCGITNPTEGPGARAPGPFCAGGHHGLPTLASTALKANTPETAVSGVFVLNRPGFRSVLQARMEPMNQKYSPEMRERALRMLDEAK